MDSVLPVINRGVISYWLESKPSELAMLVVGSDGNVSHQAIPVTEWGSISGNLEDQSDLTLVLGALDSAKVNKAGDIMTGNLTINNSSSIVRLNNNSQDWQFRAQYGDLNIEPVSTANSVFVRAGSGQQVTLTVAGINRISATANGASVTGDIRSDRAGSLSNVNPQNNIVLYGGFTGYGIGFDDNGELGTIVNSTLRSRLGQHLGMGSAGQVRFNSSADTSGAWDTLILRNATGPTLETRSAGGLRVRSADGSAAGALNCASISTSAGVVVGGQLQVVGDIAYGSGSQITWASRGVLRVPATNIFRFSNTAVNAGFSFDVTTNGTAKLRNLDNSAAGALECGAITTSGPVNVGTYTVATLPSASANAGALAQVTDSSVTTNGSAVSGGGSNRVVVFSNGSTWDVVVA